MNKSSDEFKTVFKNLVAGGIAGAVSRTTVAPLERTKILLQLHTVAGKSPRVREVLGRVWREEGWRGLFRGNGTNIVRIVPYSAVQFTVYEACKRVFGSEGTANKLLCGAIAGIASVSCTYPLDMVRTRLSLPKQQSMPRRTIFGCLSHIISTEGGIVALYRGISPTIIGIAPYVALNFTVYETLKAMAAERKKTTDLPVPERLTYGGIAGAVAQTVTYPLDVIRRRMQVANMPNSGMHYDGTLDAVRKIVNSEGVVGLYRGLLPNYLKVVPAIAVSFVCFEHVKWLIS